MANRQYLFVSYAHGDKERVLPLVNAVRDELAFRAVPIDVWMDLSSLQPGESWDTTIADALSSSIGFLFFVSPRSLQSAWLRRELEFAAKARDRLLIPVFLHRPLDGVPDALMQRQGITLSGRPSRKEIASAAESIADAVAGYLRSTPNPRPPVTAAETPQLAAQIATEFRAATDEPEGGETPKSVFVVHGHSDKALATLERFLKSADIEAVILSRQSESAQSLFQKFMSVASKAKFAVVILSSDDYGASRRQYDAVGVAERALQFRARQNVILELGFFYGRLGWENVFVLYEEPDRVFPNFERPSDLDGIVLDSMSNAAWERNLRRRLGNAGILARTSA